jgi:hypothetical protein
LLRYLSLSFSFDKYRINRFGKPGKIVNIHHKSDGTIESLDVKYLSSGEIASLLDPSLIKPYQRSLLRKSKAGNMEEKKTEEKQDTEKRSEKLATTEKQNKKQHTEKSLEKQETIEKQEKAEKKQETEKVSEKQDKSSEKEETEATQEPAAKEDNVGLTRQALKFVERRQARRNLSPRSSRRRVRRITKPVDPPKTNAESETKPETELKSKLEEATLDSELAPTPVAPPKTDAESETKPETEVQSKLEEPTLDAELTPTPAAPPNNDEEPEAKPEAELDSKLEEPTLDAELAPTPVAPPNNDEEPETKLEAELKSKLEEATLDAELTSTPTVPPNNDEEPETKPEAELDSTPEEAALDAELTPTRPSRPPRLTSTPEFMKLYEADKYAAISVPASTPEFIKNFDAEKNAAVSVPVSTTEFLQSYEAAKDEIPMNRSAEEPFPSTPKRSMERKVDTSWTESPCPISTPKRLLYQDEVSLTKTSPRDITPVPTRRVNGQVMYTTESPSVEIRARVAPHPVSTPPRSKEESLDTSSVVSTPRKNNTSSQDATLETLEDTDQSGEMEHNSSLETTLSATSVPTEENTAAENEETKLSAAVKMGKTASYLHNLLVGDSYSLDTASDSLDTASVEETDRSNSHDDKTLSTMPAPTEANTATENEEAKPKPGTVNYLHTMLVGDDSYSLGTVSIEEMDQSHSYTDQSATDDDMDERSTCSEELPRSENMEPDSRFDFCAGEEFRLVAKLFAKSSTLFTSECPPERRVPRKRSARKADKVTFADSGGDNKTSSSTPTALATEGLMDISRLKVHPPSNGSNDADQYRDRRFAC